MSGSPGPRLTQTPPSAPDTTSPAASRASHYPWWAARFWNGMPAPIWVGLLKRHGYRVSWRKFHILFGASYFAVANSVLNTLQTIICARRVDAAPQPAPIFIVGHWRSGTTHLHQILSQDPRLLTPSMYECFAPEHFLISRRVITRFKSIIPAMRPMDPIALDWNSPQEDEFALMGMGMGSPYESVAFPSALRDGLTLLAYTPTGALRGKWHARYRRFLRAVIAGRVDAPPGARVMSKSPPHTARLGLLLEAFPDARFIHIVRDPFDVFPSTVNLWSRLCETQSCESDARLPSRAEVERYVMDMFDVLYRDFFALADDLPEERIVHVRYEDLVESPMKILQNIYRQLNLGSWCDAEPALRAYVESSSGWQAARYDLAPLLRGEIWRRWGWVYGRYGYASAEARD